MRAALDRNVLGIGWPIGTRACSSATRREAAAGRATGSAHSLVSRRSNIASCLPIKHIIRPSRHHEVEICVRECFQAARLAHDADGANQRGSRPKVAAIEFVTFINGASQRRQPLVAVVEDGHAADSDNIGEPAPGAQRISVPDRACSVFPGDRSRITSLQLSARRRPWLSAASD